MSERELSFYDLTEIHAESLERRKKRLDRSKSGKTAPAYQWLTETYYGALSDTDLLNRLSSDKEHYKQNIFYREIPLPLVRAFSEYLTARTLAGIQHRVAGISRELIYQQKHALESYFEEAQEELAALGAWTFLEPSSWPILNGRRIKDQSTKIAAIIKARNKLDAVEDVFEQLLEKDTNKYYDPIIRGLPSAIRKVRTHRRLALHTEATKKLIAAIKSDGSTWDNQSYFPEILTTDGKSINWDKIVSLYQERGEDGLKTLAQRGKSKHYRELVLQDFAEWNLDSPEQRDAFFAPDDAALDVDIHQSGGGKGSMFALKVNYINRASGDNVLKANVWYFPNQKKLGIESISAYGHPTIFKNFMRGLVKMGEAQGIQELGLLAGESCGPQVWARLGAYVHREVAFTAGPMFGLMRGEKYDNWIGLCLFFQEQLDKAAANGASPELIEDISELIKIDDDKLKQDINACYARGEHPDKDSHLAIDSDGLAPKVNLYKLATRKDELFNTPIVDYLLGIRASPKRDGGFCFPGRAHRYHAYWDFNDPTQMANLKRAIHFDSSEAPNHPSERIALGTATLAPSAASLDKYQPTG